MSVTFKLKIPDCYIYLYHTDEYFILPQYPETLSDSMVSNFTAQNALGRTAPVQSYSNSGPRTMQINLQLQRDIMNDLNFSGSNVRYNRTDDMGEQSVIRSPGDDYVDVLIKKLQAIVLPRYVADSKEIIPPRVAIRFGNELFIKGVVTGAIGVRYKLPLIQTREGYLKYSDVSIDFPITETQPYDAETVGTLGSFRGLTAGLKSKVGL